MLVQVCGWSWAPPLVHRVTDYPSGASINQWADAALWASSHTTTTTQAHGTGVPCFLQLEAAVRSQ